MFGFAYYLLLQYHVNGINTLFLNNFLFLPAIYQYSPIIIQFHFSDLSFNKLAAEQHISTVLFPTGFHYTLYWIHMNTRMFSVTKPFLKD